VGRRPGGIISLVPAQTLIISSLAPGSRSASQGVVAPETLSTLQVSTTISFRGASKSHFVIPAFASPPSAQTETPLVSEGLDGDVIVEANRRHVTGSFRAPGLQVAGEDSVLALRDVTARTDVVTEHQQPHRTDTVVRIGSVAVRHRPETQATWT